MVLREPKELLFFLVKSQVADVTLAEERILKEREERTGKGGWNFGRSVAGKKMRKEGFWCRGITPRCVEWETGIQKDTKRE